MKTRIGALIALSLTAAGPAASQQPTPTPVQQRVVVPSLPDQPNKEGVVNTDGSIPTDEYGNIQTSPGVVVPNAKPGASPAPGAAAPSKGGTAAPAPGTAPLPAVPTPPPGPTGPTDVRAAYLTIRGTVKAYEKGVSITIVENEKLERTVKLAAKATVYDGLAIGDQVVLRIPLKRPADGKSTDRISKQGPPKPPAKSKFAQAQSPST